MSTRAQRMAWFRYLFGPNNDELREQNEDMRDALDHIIRVCRNSRMQSRRIRWIAERARCGLDGTTDWKRLDLPRNVDTDSKRLLRLKAQQGAVEPTNQEIAMRQIAEKQEQELAPAQDNAGSIIHVIERAAKDPNVDPDKMERMFALYERVEGRKAEQEFWTAFAEMKPNLPVITERGQILNRQGQVQSEYARYDEDIHPVITPILSQHGFSLMHRNVSTDASMVVMRSTLAHRGGHKINTEFPLSADTSGSKNDTQALGSSRSYAKRYNACDLLDIATRGKDDDGQAAGAAETITESQAAELKNQLKKVNGDKKLFLQYLSRIGRKTIARIEDIPMNMHQDAVLALERKRGQS